MYNETKLKLSDDLNEFNKEKEKYILTNITGAKLDTTIVPAACGNLECRTKWQLAQSWR